MAAIWALALQLTRFFRDHTGEIKDPVYLSRPEIHAPAFKVLSYDPSLAYEGYTFITPAHGEFDKCMYMYNNEGGLVWSGHGLNEHGHSVFNFWQCMYEEKPHLCVVKFKGHEGNPADAESYSSIIDNTYTPVRALSPHEKMDGVSLSQDLHEFNLINHGQSALMTSYATFPHEAVLNHCRDKPHLKYITAGVFVEISTDGLNTTIFKWNSLDHVDVADTYICPGQYRIRGGQGPHDGTDFFHINSIDKNEDGDYLVSGRHTSTIYKVAGNNSPSGYPPGEIIWRLGGKNNTFKHMESIVEGSGTFNFSFQHHARWRPGGIHLWDNANNDVQRASAKASSGMGIDIDEETLTATLVEQAVPPDRELDASQGSYQVLPNHNRFCGLGSVNEVYERTMDGELAFDARFGIDGESASYRSFKYAWTGYPSEDELALFAFSRNCTAPTAFHVSWNGATTVYSYRFYVSNEENGEFAFAGRVHKDWHFEISYLGDRFGRYAYAQALDMNGTVMGRTPTVKTFVPSIWGREFCDAYQCKKINYKKARQDDCKNEKGSWW